jgi:ABC-type transport system involved in multi-copper enzyme maturation permease subunit
MSARIYGILINTFREAIRNKVLYGVLGVVVAANMLAAVLGEMSLSEEARVARDVGLAGVSLFGALTAIFLGVSLLYSEIQRKTIHVILAKPIRRWEFVVGKYLGMAVTLTLLVVAFATALVVMLQLSGFGAGGNIAKALLLGWFEVLLVAAIAVFFSSFSTPFLSGIFTLALFVIGRSYGDLSYAAAKWKEPILKGIAQVALFFVPDLHIFAISGGEVAGKHVSVHGDFVSWAYVGHAALYAGAVVAILLLLAIAIFGRRDFV